MTISAQFTSSTLPTKHTSLVPTVQKLGLTTTFEFRDGQIVVVESRMIPESSELVFPDDTPWAGDLVVPRLEKLVELVESVIETFAALIVHGGAGASQAPV